MREPEILQLSFDHLIRILKASELSEAETESDRSETHVYIKIGERREDLRVQTESFELSNQYEIHLDIGPDGKMYGIEIYQEAPLESLSGDSD